MDPIRTFLQNKIGGLTPSERAKVAELLGVSDKSVRSWLNGTYPSPSYLVLIDWPKLLKKI